MAAAAAHHLRDRERGSDRSRERERHRSLDHNRSRDSSSHERDRSSSDLRESLLGQALEGGPTLIVPSVLFIFFFLCIKIAFFCSKKKIKMPNYENEAKELHTIDNDLFLSIYRKNIPTWHLYKRRAPVKILMAVIVHWLQMMANWTTQWTA